MCRPNGISTKVLLFKLVMLRKCNQKKTFLDAIKENKLAIEVTLCLFQNLQTQRKIEFSNVNCLKPCSYHLKKDLKS